MPSRLRSSPVAALVALVTAILLPGGLGALAIGNGVPHGAAPPHGDHTPVTQSGASVARPATHTDRLPAPLDGDLAGGMFHTCALTRQGAAYCWGYNAKGGLGTGEVGGSELTPVSVIGGLAFTALTAGAYHTCGLAGGGVASRGADGVAYCWGDNASGQLGDGTTEQRTVPTAVAGGLRFRAISAGVDYTCGVTTAGAAYCWGANEDGQRGDSTTAPSATPMPVHGGRAFVAISAGAHHTCALATGGAAYCWGANASGELGDGAGGRPGARSLTPVAVRGGLTFMQVATGLGARSTCGVAAVGVFCWGDGREGQLGPAAPDVCAQYGYPCAKTPHAVAGLSGPATVRQVSLGVSHACALTAAGAVHCWGSGASGRLGDGRPADQSANRATPAPVSAGPGVSFASVTTNATGACAITAGGETLCWGGNALGILGDGTTADRAVPTPVRTPSALPPVAPPARDVGTAPPELDAVDAPEPAADALEAVALAASSAGAAATLSPAAPQVALVNSDSVAARDECLTISAGSQAAYQCGDLRIVHPLPSVRLRNRLRTPTLVYNSQLARPAPVLAADVTVPTGADVPDTVRATVTFDEFAETWTRAWPGASWGSAGTTRRIAVPADGMSTPYHPTQSFTVDIAFCYNGAGCQHTVQTSWQTVWDRRTSPFGAGWWLAGLEQLEPSQKVVASGDGSAVPYRGVSTGRWAKAPLDRPDTLQAYYGNCGTAGCEYLSERQAEHGGKVIFHEWGAHEQTIGRLGDTTRFTYDSVGRLQSIVLSPGGTAGTYTFAYSSGQVQITAPPAGSIARVTTIFLTGTRVDSIRDADAHKTSFTYDGSTTRIASRTNKLGAVTKYAYDAGGKLALDSVQFTATQFAVTSFSAAETRGVLSAVSPDSAYTLLDGPRTDVSDVTRVWVGRFGAPVKIANALGDSTLLFRSNTAFPALVTSVRAPSGLVTRAAYDARGNPDSTTAVDPYGDGRDATTRYQWAPQWDFVTHVTLPEGEVTTMQYDSLTGNRLWQEDGRGTSSRVNFAYYTSGSGRGLLKTVAYPGGARDSVGYDSTGNLALTRAPLGHETRFENDGIGRAVVVRTHLDTLRTIWQDDSTTYDLNDQPTYTVSYGPAFDGAAAQRLIVRRFYDVGGQLDSLQRWSNPDPNILGTITTRWRYDAAGRRTAEVAPDGAVDSTWYDRAGNADSVHTRRGHRIVMQYDALGRLQKRILPEVVYGDTTPYSGQRFPRYPTCQTTKLCIPADTATFTYDAAGNVLTADNRDALIRRAYHRNGTLAADSLRIRTLAELGAGGNFTSHAYGLRFGYDLNGRRTWLKHPSQLAATLSSTPGVVYDSAAYGYDPATGALSRVRDVLGNVFRYAYDLNGRVDTLAYPQGHFKRFAYDLDGRVTLIRQDRTATDPLGLDYNEITLLYDVRGKLTTAQPLSVDPNGRLSYSYTALGTLKTEERSFTTDIRSDINSFAVDALGNSRTTTYSFSQTGLDNSGHTAQSTGSQPTTFTYQAATGRLLGSTLSGSSKYDQLDNVQDCPDSWQAEQRTYRHDRGGNVDWSTTDHVDTAQVRNVLTCVPSYVQTGRGATASYYGADDRLRVQDARVILSSGATVIGAAYEEHRYDALGRRVLHRTRNCVDVPDCLSQSVRVVWDGDQLLDEILFTEQDPERDDVTAYGQYSGRVLYTHGLEIDQPLTATRVGYDSSGACQAVAIAPDWDWRGQGYGHATYKPGAACNPQMKWPKRYAYLKSLMWAQYESGVGAQEMGGFFGSLLTDQRDASGQLYRRNRYYDPQTGRFTQEDPIGLAGGVNLYGFAGADPVNFSDPFGLCPPNDKNQGDCQQVTALQSLQILASAIASGEWTYSQYPSGRTNDPSTAKAGETLGDCTDFCRSAVKSALGKVWVGGPKSSTAMFKAGNHSGFAEVSRTEARAGDIVVQGGHAGIMIGIDEAGNVYGWANNGSPTRADGSGYKDSTTGTRKFNDGSFGKGTPRFYRPLVKPEQ